MFDQSKVSEHLKFIAEQKVRKAKCGKPDYANRKLWEEMEELRHEIAESQTTGSMTDNFINELGDLLFCVMGDPALAKELQARLDFDKERAERYKEIDLAKLRG